MSSDLRKRKPDSSVLPSSLSNPKPASNDVGHAALNRHRPTIAPTIFILLILVLMFALFPIFYYTQVMIPDPESTSILSNFRLKGNIILNALGHTSSAGDGRIPFNSQHKQHQPPIQPSSAKNNNVETTVPAAEEEKKLVPSSSLGPPTTETVTSVKVTDSSTTEPAKEKVRLSAEKQKKLEEDLGRFWEASSRYRREAQKQKAGEYTLQGDGTSSPPDSAQEEGASSDQLSLDQLPEADPDAKDGLTEEFWEAIKDELSADDLTIVLNDIRRSEQAAHLSKNP